MGYVRLEAGERGKEKKEISHGQKRSKVQDGQISHVPGSQKSL